MANQVKTFTITDTKINVPVVNLSTQDNGNLLEEFKSGFERTINLKKYQSKVRTQLQNQYLDYLIDPSFQRVNRIFVLSYENIRQRTSHKQYFLPIKRKKDYKF